MGRKWNEINWSTIKTGQQFQNFCNRLLEFEFGSDFLPYGAEGRDMGIDGQFRGKYGNKEGNFIFNYKFLDPSMDKSRARNLLVQQLKGTKRRKGELQKMDSVRPDFYYVLTNVKITPHYSKKIEEISEGHKFETAIWDGEKLENLIVKYPLIFQSYFGSELPLFLRYQEYFSKELGGKGLLDHSISLHNRIEEKKRFEEFLISEKKILMIDGQGGIGKTRLLIEFARIAEKQGWTQRFIRIETETFDDHLNELSPEEKHVLFLDDAHRYGNFNKLLSFVRSEESERVKLVFSTLPAFVDSLRSRVSGFQFPSDYEGIELEKLEDEEILQILKELQIPREERRIICDMSKGLPLISILVTQLIKEGVPPQDIPSHEIMQSLFDRYLDVLRTNRDNLHVDFLRILAFLVPFPIGNETIHTKIKGFLNISEAKERFIMQNLMKEKFVEAKAGKIKIIPDLLGKHLILQSCFIDSKPTGFHEEIIKQFVQSAPKQVITNLALAESRENERSLLDGFLEEIRQNALKGNGVTKLAILHILEDLSYLRPDDTLDILRNLLGIKEETFEYTDKYWGKIEISGSYIRTEIAGILKRIAIFPDTFGEAVEILRDLTLEEEEKTYYRESAEQMLLDVCGIQYHRDIRIIKGNQYQYRDDFRRIVLEKVNSWMFKSESLDDLILKILKRQLVETIEWVEKSLEKKGQISFCTIGIPENEQFKEMRKEFINVLIKIGSDSLWSRIRAKVSGTFDEIWREMNRKEEEEKKTGKPTAEKNKRRKEEKRRIFQFLVKRAEEERSWNVIDRISEIFRYFRDIGEEGTQQTANLILDRFEQDDEFQFYRVLAGTLGITEYEEIISFIRGKTEYFSGIFTPEELIQLLNRILEEEGVTYLREGFFYELGVQSPRYALDLFESLQKMDTRARTYSGYILGGLRVSSAQIATSIIMDLRAREDIETIVKSYEVLQSYGDLDEKDLDLLEEFLREADERLRIRICRVLSRLKHVNPKKYLEIMRGISREATPALAKVILRDIIPSQSGYSEDEIEICKSIITNFLPLEDTFGFNFGFVMNGIVQYDPLFLVDFLEKRIDIGKKPDVFPFDQAVQNLIKNEQYFKDVLKRIRDWMEKGDSYAMKAPSIFWEICSTPRGQIRPESESIVNEVLREWIEGKNHRRMKDVASLLLYFPLTEWILELFEEIIVESNGDQIILSSISAAIGTTSKAEMVAFGEPSPQELHQIRLLSDMIKRSTNRHVKRFAEKKIREIKEFSRWMMERMEEEW